MGSLHKLDELRGLLGDAFSVYQEANTDQEVIESLCDIAAEPPCAIVVYNPSGTSEIYAIDCRVVELLREMV